MSKNRSKLLLYIGLMLTLNLAYAVGCTPSSQEATVQIAEATQVPEPTNVVVELEMASTVSTEPPPPPTDTPEPSPASPSFELSADIAYVFDKNAKHTLDVYLPLDGESPYPTLLILHPGGIDDGNKEWMLPFAAYFASQGYASVVPNYRLMPDDIYPAPLQDCFCALAWTHSNADRYGFDPERVAVLGYSTGANLAGMIGAVDDPTPYLDGCSYTLFDDWTHGVILLAGRTILADYPTDAIAAYLGGTIDEVPDLWQEAAPVTYLDETDPPFLVVQGMADELLPIEMSEKFVAALTDAGIEHEFVAIPEASHDFPIEIESEQTAQFLTAVAEFMASLPPRPPILQKPQVLITSTEGMLGVWKMTTQASLSSMQHYEVYYKFTEDGRFMRGVDTTEFNEFSLQGNYWFEDGIFYMEYDNADMCSGQDIVGSYEVEKLAENMMTFHKVSDTCATINGARFRQMESDWERVE